MSVKLRLLDAARAVAFPNDHTPTPEQLKELRAACADAEDQYWDQDKGNEEEEEEGQEGQEDEL